MAIFRDPKQTLYLKAIRPFNLRAYSPSHIVELSQVPLFEFCLDSDFIDHCRNRESHPAQRLTFRSWIPAQSRESYSSLAPSWTMLLRLPSFNMLWKKIDLIHLHHDYASLPLGTKEFSFDSYSFVRKMGMRACLGRAYSSVNPSNYDHPLSYGDQSIFFSPLPRSSVSPYWLRVFDVHS